MQPPHATQATIAVGDWNLRSNYRIGLVTPNVTTEQLRLTDVPYHLLHDLRCNNTD